MIFTLVKWFVVTVFAALTWLVGIYTVEYYRPYKRG